jgi:hypothetical protein
MIVEATFAYDDEATSRNFIQLQQERRVKP